VTATTGTTSRGPAASEPERISFTAFGVTVEVLVPARLHPDALAVIPPGATRGGARPARATVTVVEDERELVIHAQSELIGSTADEALALGMVDAQIRAQVALLAPEHIFVHAGVVAVDGRAVAVPGSTHTGKTTLTQALVAAGAVYYSDEFAVIDAAGLVHPYPKPLSIRHPDGSGRTTETAAGALGGETGREPIPLGLIVVTSYRPGATLRPVPLSAAAAMLALLGHTIPARTRPEQSMAALRAAVQGATAWSSERGEAREAARVILSELA
jgi:hypothetical protein